MTESIVPTVRTQVAAADLYAAMRTAWQSMMSGEPCSRASLLTMLAQSALETGFWHSCWCNNLGNVKHVSGDGHDFYQIRCNEIIGGHVVWIDPPNPGCSFVAYPDLEAGVRDYLIALRGRFRSAWPAVLAGDPAEFCHQLKLARYYTADEELYTAGVLRCYHQLDAAIPPDPSDSPGGESGSAVGDPEDPLPHYNPTDTKTDPVPPPERETQPELPGDGEPPEAA